MNVMDDNKKGIVIQGRSNYQDDKLRTHFIKDCYKEKEEKLEW